jgi:DNA-binding MarR family transcriptional regulator
MAKGRTQLAADAWGAVLQVHAALVPYLDAQLQAAVGLPLTWYDVLLELAAEPGGRLRMSDLADRVVLSRTRVSRLVDELADAGLVCREQNQADKRSAYTVLTAQGRARFVQAAPVYLGGIEEHFAGRMSDGELRAIASALGRVIEEPLQVQRRR